jgi:nicotinate-nucleotide--dimethylbenzimidazole phosphoribosyltransferase
MTDGNVLAVGSETVTMDDALREMSAKTKPLGSLGHLETVGVRIARLQQSLKPRIEKARVCVFGADHGVSDEGVSAYPRVVTAEMMKNFSRDGAAINAIARSANVEVEVINVGVDADLTDLAHIRDAVIRRGTRNFAVEAAMTSDELDAAMAVGADAARRARSDGVAALGLGEMGIGNTTSASALLCALEGVSPDGAVGRGTGVDDERFARKRDVVHRAVSLHCSSSSIDARQALRRLGGLEIAAMTGAALEGSRLGLAIVADGFISSTAVLAALHLTRQNSTEDQRMLARSLFFAHRSAELGHRLVLERCGTFDDVDPTPLLDLGMRLGEGSGSALAMPILRAAAAIMREMATFESAQVSAGEHAERHGL